MNKHTPVPWEIQERERSGRNDRQIGDCLDGFPVCLLTYNGIRLRTNEAEDTDNSIFIVTACNSYDDLLEACKLALNDYHHTLDGQPTVTTESKLKAAIAKAERREK